MMVIRELPLVYSLGTTEDQIKAIFDDKLVITE